jgi:hypothetical protein
MLKAFGGNQKFVGDSKLIPTLPFEHPYDQQQTTDWFMLAEVIAV